MKPKSLSQYAPNIWDWRNMSDSEFGQWSMCENISMQLLYRWQKQLKYNTLLDLGSGLGRNTRGFARHGFDVRGLDVDPEATKIARNMTDATINAKYDIGDMCRMPYADAAFDAVFAFNILSLTSYENMRTAIDEIRRVLRPGGEVCMSLLNQKSQYVTHSMRLDNHNLVRTVQYGRHKAVFNCVAKGEIRDLLKGFEILDLDGSVHGYPPQNATHIVILARKPGITR